MVVATLFDVIYLLAGHTLPARVTMTPPHMADAVVRTCLRAGETEFLEARGTTPSEITVALSEQTHTPFVTRCRAAPGKHPQGDHGTVRPRVPWFARTHAIDTDTVSRAPTQAPIGCPVYCHSHEIVLQSGRKLLIAHTPLARLATPSWGTEATTVHTHSVGFADCLTLHPFLTAWTPIPRSAETLAVQTHAPWRQRRDWCVNFFASSPTLLCGRMGRRLTGERTDGLHLNVTTRPIVAREAETPASVADALLGAIEGAEGRGGCARSY